MDYRYDGELEQNKNYYQPDNNDDLYFDVEQAAYVIPNEGVYNAKEPKRRINIPYVTTIIIIANVIAFFLSRGAESYVYTGGLNHQYLTVYKEYGRLISHMFLHANLSHLANNMIILAIAGFSVEKYLGPLQAMIVYFGSGVGGAIITSIVKSMTDPDSTRFSIGASGAVFGMLCAMLFCSAMADKKFSLNELVTIIVLVIINVVYSSGKNVDNLAHVFGAVVGGILAFLLNIKKWNGFLENKFLHIVAGIVTVSLCIFGIGEANIGGTVKYLPDKKIDYVKAQSVFMNADVGIGEALDNYCTDETWQAFLSVENTNIVEFNGNAVYKGKEVNVRMQFKVEGDCESFLITYAEVDGKARSAKETETFLREVYDKYGTEIRND